MGKIAEENYAKKVEPWQIVGTFSEEEIVKFILRLKPGHTILIEALDNNEYKINKKTGEKYAVVIRSNSYFWRPLSKYK